jgi:Asp-tRNA(Asn)/Glu-tRNA(Gln) amidotransferase A subunit family amidase
MYLDRIKAYDQVGPKLNVIITLNPDALAEADKLDAAFKKSGFVGPMHGIPILVKDEIDAAGMPTTLGTLIFKDYRPPLDSFVVAKLKQEGAIILGKTTLSEFAGGDTYGSIFGASRNPYDLKRTVGGSSGGSGASVAANFCTVALGEETSGSIRRPGTWNDVVSLRPTPGLVSRTGMWDGWPSPVAQMGPMARSVEDVARLLDAMVGYDPADPTTAEGIGIAPPSYAKLLDMGAKTALKGARIGIIRDSIGDNSDPSSEDFKKVDLEFGKAVNELKAAGANVIDPLVIPDLKKLLAQTGADPETSDEALRLYLSRNPNSPLKTRQDIARSPYMVQSIPPTKAKAALWQNLDQPVVTDTKKYYQYVKAREQLKFNILKVMADYHLDAIVHTSIEHQPPLIKDGINPPYVSGKGLPHLNTFLVYEAAITVPAGFTSDKLPVGITFFGRPYSEPTLLRLAYSYEQATHHRKPPPTTPPLSALQ